MDIPPVLDNNPSCDICCETYSYKHKVVTCVCGYKSCHVCARTYLLTRIELPHCMSCKAKWELDFLHSSLTKTYMTKTYRIHRKQLLFDQEKSRFPETMEIVAQETDKRKLKNALKPFVTEKTAVNKSIRSLNKQMTELRRQINATKSYNKSVDKDAFLQKMRRMRRNWAPLSDQKLHSTDLKLTRLIAFKKPLLKRRKEIDQAMKMKKLELVLEPLAAEKAAVNKLIHQLNKHITELRRQINSTDDYNKSCNKNVFVNEMKKMRPNWTPLSYQEHHDMGLKLTQLVMSKSPLLKKRNKIDQAMRTIEQTGQDIDQKRPKTVRKFIRACSAEGCRGFLTKRWICGLCDAKTCAKCLEPKEEIHLCNPDNVKTAKLLKKDTKCCPKCAVSIYRISGCNQMWCTQCHIAFNWRNGAIINKRIHNPHFTQWQQANGITRPRGHREDVCGHFDITLTGISPKMSHQVRTLRRHTLHFQDTQLNRLRTRCLEIVNNEDLRIKYLIGDINEKRMKTTLITRDNKLNKENSFLQVCEFLCTVMIESLNSIKNNKSDENVEKMIQKCDDCRVYCNEQLLKISKTYTHVPQLIDKDYFLIPVNRKRQNDDVDVAIQGLIPVVGTGLFDFF